MITNVLRVTGLVWILACSLSGCSKPNGRFTVSGTVTFDGKPVPVGNVAIEPDPSAGNHGPQAFAEIKDGRFQTAPAKGAIAGPVVVEVWAADGIETAESPLGKYLFKDYQLKMTLPEKANTLDIVVPPEAAAGIKKK